MAEIDYESAVSGKRKVKTTDGLPVRLVSDQGIFTHPLVGVVAGQHGEQGPLSWTRDGKYIGHGSSHPSDIIQEPEVIEFKRWVNVYHDLSGLLHRTEASARAYLDGGAIAIAVPITITKRGDKIVIHGESE